MNDFEEEQGRSGQKHDFYSQAHFEKEEVARLSTERDEEGMMNDENMVALEESIDLIKTRRTSPHQITRPWLCRRTSCAC